MLTNERSWRPNFLSSRSRANKLQLLRQRIRSICSIAHIIDLIMTNKSIFWAGLVGAAATIPLVQMSASAKSATEINKIAQSITVMISEPGSQGSGVILQKQGDVYTVLTAAHVVKKKDISYSLVTPDGQKHQIIPDSIRRPTQDIDVAVVKFRASANYPTAKLGNCNLLAGGADLYVGGYPAPTETITQSVFVFRTGNVSANSDKTFKNGYSLVYSNDTLPGMSGGVVLNSAGELVAIHGKGDREKVSDGKYGAKTGFNLGIPINRFGTISSSLGVDLEGKVAAIPQNTALKADDYVALGGQKYFNQDYLGALAEYNRALKLNPNYVEAYSERGRLKENRFEDFQGALADYNRAIQLKPNDPKLYINRAIFKSSRAFNLKPNETIRYMNRADFTSSDLKYLQEALADYNRAIQLKPNDPELYTYRAHFKSFYLEDLQGALADYNRYVQLKPNDPGAYTVRASFKKFSLNDPQGALADSNRAIQLKPNDPELYTDRAWLKESLEDLQGALADYNRSIQLKPNDSTAYRLRASFKAQKLKDLQGGLADFNRAVELNNPDDPFYYIWRGVFKAATLKDFQGARADFNRYVQLKPNDPEAYTVRAEKILKFLNDLQGALVDYNRAVQLKPNDPSYYSQRGRFKYEYLEDRAGGIADIRQAAKLYKQQGNEREYKSAIEQLKQWGASDRADMDLSPHGRYPPTPPHHQSCLDSVSPT